MGSIPAASIPDTGRDVESIDSGAVRLRGRGVRTRRTVARDTRRRPIAGARSLGRRLHAAAPRRLRGARGSVLSPHRARCRRRRPLDGDDRARPALGTAAFVRSVRSRGCSSTPVQTSTARARAASPPWTPRRGTATRSSSGCFWSTAPIRTGVPRTTPSPGSQALRRPSTRAARRRAAEASTSRRGSHARSRESPRTGSRGSASASAPSPSPTARGW
jgi:hypothetical protein